MHELSLVILAAGLGSRYGGLKQVDPIGPNGEFLIEYSIYDALAVGINHIIFVIQPDQQQAFQDAFSARLQHRCRTSFVYQRISDVPAELDVPAAREKPWGTGHAVLSARQKVSGPFGVINADDFYGRASYAQLAGFLRSESDECYGYAMVGFDLKKTLGPYGTVSRGVCKVSPEGELIGIDERTKVGMLDGKLTYWDEFGTCHGLADSSIASMNMWAFPQAFMVELEGAFKSFLRRPFVDSSFNEFFLPDVVNDLIEKKRARVRVLQTTETWMGMTYRQDLEAVRRGILARIDAGIYPRTLWNEVM